MTDGDAALFEEVGAILLGRRGWGLEPSTSPGSDPSYCFSPEHEVELSVSVRAGSIRIYIPRSDDELEVGSPAELAAWVDVNEVRFHRA